VFPIACERRARSSVYSISGLRAVGRQTFVLALLHVCACVRCVWLAIARASAVVFRGHEHACRDEQRTRVQPRASLTMVYAAKHAPRSFRHSKRQALSASGIFSKIQPADKCAWHECGKESLGVCKLQMQRSVSAVSVRVALK
jgi:hypothetical protein